jgi:2-oxoglutarate dehydrogenase E2 component (dihydrolipoamide succinyltransferase)
VTPIVRKLAAELGVNLASVKGTGVGGRIRKEDIQAAAKPVAAPVATPAEQAPAATKSAAPVAASPLRGTTVPMSRLRKVIAARMVSKSRTGISRGMLTTVVEVGRYKDCTTSR